MLISTWVIVVALAAGSGFNQLAGSDATDPDDARPKGKIASHCWINGVWYNPCPESDPGEQPPPEILPPT
jgi:hypothetical protein